ncbi:MAG: hypothetical protein ACKO5W_02270, partial [Crocinitomicaceae bacterium]
SQNLIETECPKFYDNWNNEVYINSNDENIELLSNTGVITKTKVKERVVYMYKTSQAGVVELYLVKKEPSNKVDTLEIKKVQVTVFPAPECNLNSLSLASNSRVRIQMPPSFCYFLQLDVTSISYLGKKYKGDIIKYDHLREMKPGENLNLQINYRRSGSKVQRTMLTTLIIRE